MAGRAVRALVTNRSVLKIAFIVKLSFLSTSTSEAFSADETAKAGMLILEGRRLKGTSMGGQQQHNYANLSCRSCLFL